MAEPSAKKKIFDNRYEIVSIVGRGEKSVVYHARHVLGGGEVALKVLLSHKDPVKMTDGLRKEALAMVSSRHKYVVRLDDFHSIGDLAYISMEFAPESDLRRYTNKIGGKLLPDQGQLFMMQIADALTMVHRARILHRDIKPDNLLVVSDVEIRLGDFGVALLPGDYSASIDELKKGVGTLNYMAPEVLEGTTYDERSEIYSLGLTFYELMAGKHPFADAPLAKQVESRTDDKITPIAKLVPEIPKEFAAAVMRCLRYRPEDRFGSANELIEFLVDADEQEKLTPANPKVVELPAPKEPSPPPKVTPAQKPQSIAETVKAKEPLEEEDDQDEIESPTEENEPPPAATPKKASSLVQGAMSASSANKITPTETKPATGGYKPSALTTGIPKNIGSSRRMVMPDKFSRLLRTLVVAIVLTLVFIWGGRALNSVMARVTGIDVVGKIASTFSGPSGNTTLPNNLGSDFSFSQLEPGVYAGSIQDIIPGRPLPLSLVMLSPDQGMAVVVGLEGWTPRLISGETLKAHKGAFGERSPLQVASNGMIFDFDAQRAEDQIAGYFRNTITGETGTWLVHRLR